MIVSSLIAAAPLGAAAQVNEEFAYNDERFADLQMLRYKVEGFESLTLQQKKYIYYLTEASLQGRDILYDQNGKYNLRIRKTLETISNGCGSPTASIITMAARSSYQASPSNSSARQ